MIDIDLLERSLRERGHVVGHVIHVPENAGGLEMLVDGRMLTLDEVRLLLAEEQLQPDRQLGDRPEQQPDPTTL